MTLLQKSLVQASWSAMSPKAESVAHLFYHRLFATTPAARDMFANVDPVDQVKKLVAALTTVVNGLDEIGSIGPLLAGMGRRHASYGVTDEEYDAVGAALLWTFEAVLRPEWTNELRDAWSEAYRTVAQAMRDAAGTGVPAISGKRSGQSNRQIRPSQEEV